MEQTARRYVTVRLWNLDDMEWMHYAIFDSWTNQVHSYQQTQEGAEEDTMALNREEEAQP